MEGEPKKEGGEGEGGKHFIGQLVKADDSIKFWYMHSGMTGQVGGFKIVGFVCKHFPPFFPIPSRLFFSPHFCVVFDSHS